MKESPGKGQDRELSIEKVEVLGECDPVVRVVLSTAFNEVMFVHNIPIRRILFKNRRSHWSI